MKAPKLLLLNEFDRMRGIEKKTLLKDEVKIYYVCVSVIFILYTSLNENAFGNLMDFLRITGLKNLNLKT